MSISDKIKKAITGGEWFIAYRTVGETEYKIAEAPANQWCADPFIYEVNGEHYIFVEQYRKDKDKGCIGYFHFENGIPVNKGIIIENSYHMSYPDVFEYNGKHYMIPESSANRTVDLYVAERFPDKWKLEKTLISGRKNVDSTVYKDDNKYYLISYNLTKGNEIHVFRLDLERKEVKQISRKKYEENTGRPGGRLFIEDGKLMRPAQDCSHKYGEAIIIYQVDDFNRRGEYVEHEVGRIDAKMLNSKKRPERIHQLTCDSIYGVVDIYKERVDLFHAPKIFFRSHRK